MDLDALIRDLDGLAVETNPTLVRQKSRDFYWYSPLLKRQLDHVTGDLVVSPKSEDEVARVVRACFAHGVPVTARGGGTGNYGQAMPLSGGVVLNLAGLDAIHHIGGGRVVAGAGANLHAIDEAARAAARQEMRMHPSTARLATVGGFIAGGSGGVGSVRWGGLRALGNILRLRIVTCEAEPRTLDLVGDELHKVVHAYGTNGIITEVELPTAEAQDWVDAVVAFDDFMEAARFARIVAEADGLLVKEVAPIAAPIPHDYFVRHRRFVRRDQSVVLLMAAPFAMDGLDVLARRAGGALAYRSDLATEAERHGLPPVYELAWNHTTLRALRIDPTITYLQCRYPDFETLERIRALFGDEVPVHIELIRSNGAPTMAGLPLVRFTSEERLNEIIRIYEDNGCAVFNPHVYTLEEGGMKQTDRVQLAFKRETDPKGLLNPGKMIAWDDPDFDFEARRPYIFPGIREVR